MIFLNEYQLEVAQACSGLRIFVGILALAYAFIVLARRAWWEKAILAACVAPIALATTRRGSSSRASFTNTFPKSRAEVFHDAAGGRCRFSPRSCLP